MARCAQLPIIPASPKGKSEETQGDYDTHLPPGSDQAIVHLSTDDDVVGCVDHECVLNKNKNSSSGIHLKLGSLLCRIQGAIKTKGT